MSSLARVLEHEAMDSIQEALAYDAMDHGEVNRRFAADFLAALGELRDGNDGPCDVLDLGAGTALIPVEICRQSAAVRVTAVDLSAAMLSLGRKNVERAGLAERISCELADAKRLPHAAERFAAVISNSIVHHLPDPAPALQEAIRVTRVGGLLFFRDLARPNDESHLDSLVNAYAADCDAFQRAMFADSLRAALSLEEISELVAGHGFPRQTVRMTSDRHWTWQARKTAAVR